MVIVEGEGAVLGLNLGRHIVSNGDFVAWLCDSDVLFPNYFGRLVVVVVVDWIQLLLILTAYY